MSKLVLLLFFIGSSSSTGDAIDSIGSSLPAAAYDFPGNTGSIQKLVAGLGLDVDSPEWIRDRWGWPHLRYMVPLPLDEVVRIIRAHAGEPLADGWRVDSFSKNASGDLWLFPAVAGDGGVHTIEVRPFGAHTELSIPIAGRYAAKPGRGRILYCPDELSTGKALPEN